MGWPPSISRCVLRRLPRDLREEGRQVAWLAWLDHKNPSTAVRNWLRRQRRIERRDRLFSQLARLPKSLCRQLGDELAVFRSFPLG